MNSRYYIYELLKNNGVEESEISAETNFILENCFGIKNPYSDFVLSDNDKIKLDEISSQRGKGLPLQYILNIADFLGEKFIVNKYTLIPRQETEILVNEVIKKVQNQSIANILDIGTGTGCIAIMLKKLLPVVDVSACDISVQALNTAKENAKKHNTDIDFIHSDLFHNIDGRFDIIVSNPPYIPPKMKETIQKEVSFEPDNALYTKDEKGIEFYEKIISAAGKYLTGNGYVIFELGIKQSDMVKKLFTDYNYSQIEIVKDLNGIDRVISAKVQK